MHAAIGWRSVITYSVSGPHTLVKNAPWYAALVAFFGTILRPPPAAGVPKNTSTIARYSAIWCIIAV